MLFVCEKKLTMSIYFLQAGMEQLPGNAFMIILYSSFLIDVKDGFQSGLSELAAARKADKRYPVVIVTGCNYAINVLFK
jgi:hypothetical protein